MKTELAIRGGTVVDGSGNPGVRADLGIAGGRIVEIDIDALVLNTQLFECYHRALHVRAKFVTDQCQWVLRRVNHECLQ